MSVTIERTVPRLSLNQQEAAAALGVSVDHFERYVKPYVACVVTGRRRLYPVTAIQRWLDERALLGGRRVA